MRNLQGRWQHHRRNAIPGRHHPGLRRCKGQRFKSEVLEVRYNELNINEVLNLTVEEAMEFFS